MLLTNDTDRDRKKCRIRKESNGKQPISQWIRNLEYFSKEAYSSPNKIGITGRDSLLLNHNVWSHSISRICHIVTIIVITTSGIYTERSSEMLELGDRGPEPWNNHLSSYIRTRVRIISILLTSQGGAATWLIRKIIFKLSWRRRPITVPVTICGTTHLKKFFNLSQSGEYKDKRWVSRWKSRLRTLTSLPDNLLVALDYITSEYKFSILLVPYTQSAE